MDSSKYFRDKTNDRSLFQIVSGEVGRFLIFFSLAFLAFLAYMLWGTGSITQASQDKLKIEIKNLMPAPLIPGTKVSKTVVEPVNLPPSPKTQPPSGSALATITIPVIGLQMVVVQGTDTNDLKLGPGHYTNSSLPGYGGNVAIAGHRTTYLHPFYSLNNVQAGSQIFLSTPNGTLEYLVTNIDVRSPSSIWVLNPSPTNDILTLTTCNPRYSAATRLVVTAHYYGTVETKTSGVPSTPKKVVQKSGNSGIGSQIVLGNAGSGYKGSILPGALAFFVYALIRLAFRKLKLRFALLLLAAGLLCEWYILFYLFQEVAKGLPASF